MSNHRRNSCQLSKKIEPIHYDLYLDFNPDETVFHGQVTIDIWVKDTQPCIYLNCVDLEIAEVLLNNEQCLFRPDKAKQLVRINPERCILSETYKLKVKYSGRLRADGLGLIRNVSGKGNEAKKVVIWTNGELKSARRVFPCFDDPSYLTTFQLTVRTLQSLKVIANMDLYQRDIQEAYSTIVFHKMIKKVTTMSLTLVAGEFQIDKSPDTDQVQVRFYAYNGSENLSSEHALDVARKMIELYSNSFQPYPLRKLDIVALPTSTTLSTYGIILMPKEKLLINPAQSSERRRKLVALSLCNAMAYQWFDSIVQHIWKANSWLHEAIALWCQYFGADAFDSNWEMWNEFFAEVHQKALKYDDRRECGPLETESNVNVAKYKGACLIQMLYHWMGQERFLQGVKNYLKGYHCLLTDSVNFYVSLKNATNADLDVGRVMAVWGSQRGYPLIKVKVTKQHNLLLKQKMCLKNSDDADEWPIPIHLAAINNPNSDTIRREEMTNKELVITVGDPSWINLRLNPFCRGFYRVYYGGQEMNQNIVMNLSNYSLADRIAYQNDWFATVLSGRWSAISYYDTIIRAYSNGERNYLVWRCIAKNLKRLNLIVEVMGGLYDAKFQYYVFRMLTPNYERLKRTRKSDWTSNDHFLFGLLYKLLVLYGHTEATETCLDTITRNVKYGDHVNRVEQAGCYATVASSADDVNVDSLIAYLEEEKNVTKRYEIIKGLGQSKPSRLMKLLNRMLRLRSKYTIDELIYLLRNSTKSQKRIPVAWEFITTNYTDLHALCSATQLAEIFKIVTRHITKRYQYQYYFVHEFLASKSNDIPKKIRKEITSVLKRNSELLREGQRSLQLWLDSIPGFDYV